MYPELFRIPVPFFDTSLPIYGYGLMVVLGFLCASFVARRLANRSGFDGQAFVDAALLALIAGIVGARLSHVLENPSHFFRSDFTAAQTLKEIANIPSGGLTYYGGFLFATPALIFYAIRKKIHIPAGMDIVAIVLMIALGFGRIGCFMNGCCHGQVCPESLPWAVTFPYGSNPYIEQFRSPATHDRLATPVALQEMHKGQLEVRSLESIRKDAARAELEPLALAHRSLPVHPAQLYSTITCFLLAGLLFAFYTLPHRAGRGFALMLILEGTTRFILEALRTEPARVGSLSFSMVIGLMLVGSGVFAFWLFGRIGRPIETATTA